LFPLLQWAISLAGTDWRKIAPYSERVLQMSNEEALRIMRQLAQDPEKYKAMHAAWGTVMDRLGPFYMAMRPQPKSFEVHHMNETARQRFAHAVAAGHTFEDCAYLAVERIKG
jgi:hypothetical protein